jgi:hypothetical protein
MPISSKTADTNREKCSPQEALQRVELELTFSMLFWVGWRRWWSLQAQRLAWKILIFLAA